MKSPEEIVKQIETLQNTITYIISSVEETDDATLAMISNLQTQIELLNWVLN